MQARHGGIHNSRVWSLDTLCYLTRRPRAGAGSSAGCNSQGRFLTTGCCQPGFLPQRLQASQNGLSNWRPSVQIHGSMGDILQLSHNTCLWGLKVSLRRLHLVASRKMVPADLVSKRQITATDGSKGKNGHRCNLPCPSPSLSTALLSACSSGEWAEEQILLLKAALPAQSRNRFFFFFKGQDCCSFFSFKGFKRSYIKLPDYISF